MIKIIMDQAGQINTNGDKNTYNYTVKLGAIIETLQAGGDYVGDISFDIELDYFKTGRDVTGTGVATASSTYSANAPADGFDNNTTTSGWGNNNIMPSWLQYDFGVSNSKKITRYSLMRSSSQVGGWTNDTWSPVDWTFEGSNDAASWTVLDTRNIELIMNNAEKKQYSFSNTTSYRYYRINMTANNGGTNWVNITEMEMFE